jgi:hypothetical protein
MQETPSQIDSKVAGFDTKWGWVHLAQVSLASLQEHPGLD